MSNKCCFNCIVGGFNIQKKITIHKQLKKYRQVLSDKIYTKLQWLKKGTRNLLLLI